MPLFTALSGSVVITPNGDIRIRYHVTEPTDVAGISQLRLWTTPARSGSAAYDVGPGVLVTGTTDTYDFTLPGPVPEALYYATATLVYTDASSTLSKDAFLLPPLDSGLLNVEDYQQITKDTTTDPFVVAEALLDAQGLVEEYLRRPLALATRTARLRLYRADAIDSGYDGSYLVYPPATPVQSAENLTVVSPVAVAGGFPDGGPFLQGIVGLAVEPYATVTYTGGWTRDTLPRTIRREIAQTARGLLAPNNVPVGATAVRVGDTSVTYADAAAVGAGLSPSSCAALRKYKRRRAA
jgi:hypothetical protein